ncbi:hypothetical protein PR048_001601 [Dryococelus australis]|uniref:Uncharacterized protein n=1 Tax=Dryococelus australis TaxID=614101 RepID=A0ABQ9III5_9NEOP|nr:hypothetical protein PR048_001601 [Dryococelus australis]
MIIIAYMKHKHGPMISLLCRAYIHIRSIRNKLCGFMLLLGYFACRDRAYFIRWWYCSLCENNLKHKLINKSDAVIYSVCVEVGSRHNDKNIQIGGYNIPSHVNINSFLTKVDPIFNQWKGVIFLIGDININYIYFNFGYTLRDKIYAIRETGRDNSLIDHVVNNTKREPITMININVADKLSYHNILTLILPTDNYQPNMQYNIFN